MSYLEAQEKLRKQREQHFYDRLAAASLDLEDAVRAARKKYEDAVDRANSLREAIENAAENDVDADLAQSLATQAYQLRWTNNPSEMIVSGTVSASRIAVGSITAGSAGGSSFNGKL